MTRQVVDKEIPQGEMGSILKRMLVSVSGLCISLQKKVKRDLSLFAGIF